MAWTKIDQFSSIELNKHGIDINNIQQSSNASNDVIKIPSYEVLQ
jgi:hypothetical protein